MENNETMINETVNNEAVEAISQNDMPIADFEAINNASPEERVALINDYSQKLCEYQKTKDKENENALLEKYNEAVKYIEGVKAKEELSSVSEFSDFSKMLPKVEKLTSMLPCAQSMSPMELYTISYLVAKGIESTGNSTPKTIEEKLLEINSDEKLMRAIEEQRINQLANRKDLPAFSAGGGFSSSTVNLTKKPMTIDQAFKQSMEELG